MTAARTRRIVVGLSGGVDSALTAWFLKRAGHEVVGIFMKNWEEDDDDEYCSSCQDFLDHAVRLGAERIATGHYARVREAAPGRFELLKGLDGTKDQSYFLHRLTQAQ